MSGAYPISKLLTEIVGEDLSSKVDFMTERLGYRDPLKGVRRLHLWIESGDGHQRIIGQISRVTGRGAELERAIADTREMKTRPYSTRQIETIVGGQTVRGTVRLTGSSRIDVKLDWPAADLSTSSQLSFFTRVPPGEPGYLGKFGETVAMNFLLSLYEQYKKGARRRQFPGVGREEFGRVRYLAISPGYPGRDVKILEKAALDVSVYAQLERDGRRRRARFFDSRTDQAFLVESSFYEEGIQVYIVGVKADLGFSRHLETVRLKLLPEMLQNSALLKTYRVNPYQADFLKEFSSNWRAAKMPPLGSPEIGQLIELGYLSSEITAQNLDPAVEQLRREGKRTNAHGQNGKVGCSMKRSQHSPEANSCGPAQKGKRERCPKKLQGIPFHR